ncbi:glycine N-phenylacetyltransferase-like [Saccoglossus kowalevskii]|uniref:Glycine N-acyltransferase-like protein n=1 Tax=Saccoglossus kowalevskii TaxID=10224 RepID=A0ABM0MU31_SACKO|nr:PREDICTED: glycine N-phenylacetyltransferase-like [Saccoglossus kowalevskii]
MAVVAVRELPILIQALQKWMPYCNSLLSMMKNSLLSENVWPHMAIYTDDIKKCTTVVGAAINYHLSPFDRTYYIHSTNITKLQEVLNTTGVINWNKTRIMIENMPMSGFQIIHDVAKNRGFQLIYNKPCNLVLLKNKELCAKTAEKSLPFAMRYGSLQNEHIPLIENRWWMNNETTPPSILSETLKHCKSFAAFDPNGTPVSWGIHKECGALGYGFSEPKYRGSGLHMIIQARFCTELSNAGITPYFYIAKNNIPPMKVATKVGFEKLEGFVTTRLVFTKIQ